MRPGWSGISVPGEPQHQGHLMAQGTPEQIISDPALAEIYFGGAL
jgi:hypothetical protein